MSEIISNVQDFESDIIDISNNTIKTNDFLIENNNIEKKEIDKRNVLTKIKLENKNNNIEKYNNYKSVLKKKKDNIKKKVKINDNCSKIENDAKQFIQYQNKVINECSNQSLELVDLLQIYERESKINSKKLMFVANDKKKLEEECNNYVKSQQNLVSFLCILMILLIASCILLIVNSKYLRFDYDYEQSKWD